MTDLFVTNPPELPVLVACGACGNIDELLVVISSSFGLTALLALGQYTLDRVRQRLGFRRDTRADLEESASCFRVIGGRTDDPEQAR